MVVTLKSDVIKTRFVVLKAFEFRTWIRVLTGVIVWLNEYANNNPEFRDPFPENIGSVLWFSVTILSYTQPITSAMTVPEIEPSVADVNHLLRTDAPVGCNFSTIIVRFLINVSYFKPENVRQISAISDYPKAF